MAALPNMNESNQKEETKEAARKRDYEVVDADALYAAYPQFFKYTPDYTKIRQAIKLGLQLPGVKFLPGHPNYVPEAAPSVVSNFSGTPSAAGGSGVNPNPDTNSGADDTPAFLRKRAEESAGGRPDAPPYMKSGFAPEAGNS